MLLSYMYVCVWWCTCTAERLLINVTTQRDHYGSLLSHTHTCILCGTVLLFAGCHYWVLFASQTSVHFLNLLFTKMCVCVCVCVVNGPVCLFQGKYGHALTLRECDGILIESSWIGGPSGAVSQNNGEPIMGAVHFTGAIWLAITKKQIALMTNKILTEAMPSSMMGWNWCYFIVIESYWQH